MAAHFKDAARSGTTGCGMAKTGVEEAGVMHPEFPDHRQIGCHFCGIVGGNRHRLAADKDVEGPGVEDDAAVAGAKLFPEVGNRVVADPVKVDHPGMRLGAVADQIASQTGFRSTEKPSPSEITASPDHQRLLPHAGCK